MVRDVGLCQSTDSQQTCSYFLSVADFIRSGILVLKVFYLLMDLIFCKVIVIMLNKLTDNSLGLLMT